MVSKPVKYTSTALLSLVVAGVSLFQNCSPNKFTTDQSSLSIETPEDNINGPANPSNPNDPNNPGSPNNPSSPKPPPAYSENCDDYSSKGWTSFRDCITDGRWHNVFTNAGGAVSRGSITSLQGYLEEGAEFKVVTPTQNIFYQGNLAISDWNGMEHCRSVYRSSNGNRPIYCLTAARFAGEGSGGTTHGSARFGTDGSAYCNTIGSSGNSCVLDPLSYKWYIRY